MVPDEPVERSGQNGSRSISRLAYLIDTQSQSSHQYHGDYVKPGHLQPLSKAWSRIEMLMVLFMHRSMLTVLYAVGSVMSTEDAHVRNV